jgi:hypothetical protein
MVYQTTRSIAPLYITEMKHIIKFLSPSTLKPVDQQILSILFVAFIFHLSFDDDIQTLSSRNPCLKFAPQHSAMGNRYIIYIFMRLSFFRQKTIIWVFSQKCPKRFKHVIIWGAYLELSLLTPDDQLHFMSYSYGLYKIFTFYVKSLVTPNPHA